MRRLIFPALVTAIVSVIMGCTSGGLIYPIVPHIDFISFSHSVIKDNDTVKITLSYTDGDGDLGHDSSSDTKTLFIIDTQPYSTISKTTGRDTVIDSTIIHSGFFPPLLTSSGKASISGLIKYGGGGTGSFSRTDKSRASVVTRFQIYVVDQAGHKSNTVTTSPVTLVK